MKSNKKLSVRDQWPFSYNGKPICESFQRWHETIIFCDKQISKDSHVGMVASPSFLAWLYNSSLQYRQTHNSVQQQSASLWAT